MNAVRTLIALLLLAPTPDIVAGRGDFRVQNEGASVDAMIAAFMAEHRVPGMSLAIVQAPYITRVTGYGFADPQTRTLIGTRTVFSLGELQNGYTAVAVLQLVENQKLSLGDNLGLHLKDLPTPLRNITVRDILRQSSGLPDYPTNVRTEKAALSAASRAKPLFAPGTRIQPSNTNQLLLAKLITAVAGTSYEEVITKGQIERLGLRETFFAGRLPASENLADKGRHQFFLQQPLLINPIEAAVGTPAAPGTPPLIPPLLASSNDISIWDVGLAGEILIRSPELRALLYTASDLPTHDGVASSGCWNFPGRPGLMTIQGSSPDGCSSFLSRYTAPDELLCVTLLANRPGLNLAPLAAQIAAAFDARLIQTGKTE